MDSSRSPKDAASISAHTRSPCCFSRAFLTMLRIPSSCVSSSPSAPSRFVFLPSRAERADRAERAERADVADRALFPSPPLSQEPRMFLVVASSAVAAQESSIVAWRSDSRTLPALPQMPASIPRHRSASPVGFFAALGGLSSKTLCLANHGRMQRASRHRHVPIGLGEN